MEVKCYLKAKSGLVLEKWKQSQFQYKKNQKKSTNNNRNTQTKVFILPIYQCIVFFWVETIQINQFNVKMVKNTCFLNFMWGKYFVSRCMSWLQWPIHIRFIGKMLDQLFNVQMFSNPGDKFLILVENLGHICLRLSIFLGPCFLDWRVLIH